MTHAESISPLASLPARSSGWSRWVRAARLMLARDGVAALARRGWRRLWLRERYLVYVRALTDDDAAAPSPGPITIRRASAADRARLAGCADDLGAAQYWDVLDPTAECYLGWDGERIVAVHWVSTTHETNGLVALAAGDCVIGPCVTAPSYRGRGIYPMVLAAICRDRRRLGQRRAYMVVNVDNHASIRGIEKAGFQRTQRMTLTRRLGRQRVAASGAGELS